MPNLCLTHTQPLPNSCLTRTSQLVGGTGAAAVMTLTFPYIDDIAPPRLRTVWFGVLGLCQPVGIGIGYMAIGKGHGNGQTGKGS